MLAIHPTAPLTAKIIGHAIKVHRALGPGLLESVYAQCLAWEFQQDGLPAQREVALPVVYEGFRLERAYVADMIVDSRILLEIKSVEHVPRLHEAQTLTYLRLSGCEAALLLNFNCALLKDGLRRFVA